MCNLYNITTSQDAIREWTRALRDIMGNLEPSVDIYPNMPGPVVRNAPDGVRELMMARWGHARAAAVWRCSDHQHTQHQEPALACVAPAGKPLRRPIHFVLRICGHQASQNPDMVRTG